MNINGARYEPFPDGDISIVRVEDARTIDPHWHEGVEFIYIAEGAQECAEISYVVSGCCDFYTDGEVSHAREGDVHVISPGSVYTKMIAMVRPDLTPEGMMLPGDIADIIGVYLQFRKTNAVIDEIEAHRVTKEPFA